MLVWRRTGRDANNTMRQTRHFIWYFLRLHRYETRSITLRIVDIDIKQEERSARDKGNAVGVFRYDRR